MAWFQHFKLQIHAYIYSQKIQSSYLSMAMDSKACSLFPFELWEEILCRVPTKSLLRFKLTCKRWRTLLQDKRFIYKHLTFLQEQIIRTNHMVKIINPVIQDYSSLSLPFEFQFKPEIHNMVHCDGLLLCILESGSIAVWNPCLNHVRWVKSMVSSPVCCFYGIGYNSLCRDGYKILRFMNSVFTNNNAKIDIYELNSNSWKTFTLSLDWHVVSHCRGVSLKGNMYWIAKRNRKSDIFIQSFNFSTETFEPLCSFPFEYVVASDVVTLSTFRRDNLSLLHQCKETAKIEIWVTNKVKNGEIISWSKFFNVTRPDLPILCADGTIASPVHFIDKKNRIVVCCEEVLEDENNVCVNIYLIEDGEVRRQYEIERHQRGFSWPFISGYAYLPSLVPVPT
ncbi:F-box/WD-40 repeat-containing protein 1 [Cardamine amara subsp. amara]|uniref:F-box/WD-40 repeat-containing protein 1 n=1 Tax=Cardamine amara subsp. amara TaxID=228776 RepID=A0ABD1AF64_CARAN